MAKTRQVKRGEIYLVRLNPTLGVEIAKTRPALIIQNDIDNRYSPMTIVAPVTSQPRDPLRPTNVVIKAQGGGLASDSTILLNQIRSVDKRRLGKRLGRLTPATMDQVDRAIEISLGLVET